jgi:hypothetical protein
MNSIGMLLCPKLSNSLKFCPQIILPQKQLYLLLKTFTKQETDSLSDKQDKNQANQYTNTHIMVIAI